MATQLTVEQAMDLLEKYRGEVRCDYKCPEWDDFTERECVWHVVLWRPSQNYAVGVPVGGDTFLEAFTVAYEELLRREARDGAPAPQGAPTS